MQIDTVIAACKHPDIVRALFSATLPEAVESLARSVLQDPLRITVGERNTGARVEGCRPARRQACQLRVAPSWCCASLWLRTAQLPLGFPSPAPCAAASTVAQRLLFVGREEGKLLALRQLIAEGLRPPVLVFVATKERAKELHRCGATRAALRAGCCPGGAMLRYAFCASRPSAVPPHTAPALPPWCTAES